MTRPRLLASALAPLVALWLAGAADAGTPRTLVAKVDRISDGDTVTARTSEGTTLRLRLLGIDAPEMAHGTKPGQPFGEEARDYLDHLIGGKVVRVDTYGVDRYHRILAVVWDEQVNVNLLIVAMGYAEVYRGAPARCPAAIWSKPRPRRGRTGWACGRRGPAMRAPRSSDSGSACAASSDARVEAGRGPQDGGPHGQG